jgi:hypothetical protein
LYCCCGVQGIARKDIRIQSAELLSRVQLTDSATIRTGTYSGRSSDVQHSSLCSGNVFCNRVCACVCVCVCFYVCVQSTPSESWHVCLIRAACSSPHLVACPDRTGGMRRRLSVAIALLGDPEVVYLDEPTTGVSSCLLAQTLLKPDQVSAQHLHHTCSDSTLAHHPGPKPWHSTLASGSSVGAVPGGAQCAVQSRCWLLCTGVAVQL